MARHARVLGLVVLFLFGSALSAEVPRERRALLLVMNLSGPVKEDLRWFYRLGESYFVRDAHKYGRPAYSGVWLLDGEKATLENLRRGLTKLGDAMDAVDLLVELHGLPGAIAFSDGVRSSAEVAEKLRGIPHLRAVYSAACYGTTHTADWLGAGFRVASGARKINTNGLWDFPAFLKSWTAGKTFGEAQTFGNHAAWRKFFDRAAKRLGLGDDPDSFKDVAGESRLRLTSAAAAMEGELDGLTRLDDAEAARRAPRPEDVGKLYEALGFKAPPKP